MFSLREKGSCYNILCFMLFCSLFNNPTKANSGPFINTDEKQRIYISTGI